METIFYIKFTIRAADGFEHFGQFFIGNDGDFAYNLFRQLKGKDEVSENNILQLDFMEARNSLPLNIRMIRCTLNEMAENCRIITKEMFKFYNLKET